MIWRRYNPGAGALLCAMLCAAICGCKKPAKDSAPAGWPSAKDESRIVLRVNATSCPVAAFRDYVQESVGGSVQELDATTLSDLFDRFVDDKILLQAAIDSGIALSTEEKQAYLEKTEEGTWTEEEKASALSSDSGLLVDKMRIEKYIRGLVRDISVGDDEVKAYYDGRPGEFFLPERVQVSQILVPTEHEAVETWEKARSSDEEGFRALALAESIGPEASTGGEMGVYQKGQLPADMEAAVFAMKEGEVSPIVQSSYGYHIFRLDKRFAPEQVSFESAAPSIRKKLMELKSEAAAARHVEELKKNVDWEVFPEYLFFPYQRTDI